MKQFHTDDPQILGITEESLVARPTWSRVFLYSAIKVRKIIDLPLLSCQGICAMELRVVMYINLYTANVENRVSS
jgi:hypothetical protein